MRDNDLQLMQEAAMELMWLKFLDYCLIAKFHVGLFWDQLRARADARREERRNAEYPNG